MVPGNQILSRRFRENLMAARRPQPASTGKTASTASSCRKFNTASTWGSRQRWFLQNGPLNIGFFGTVVTILGRTTTSHQKTSCVNAFHQDPLSPPIRAVFYGDRRTDDDWGFDPLCWAYHNLCRFGVQHHTTKKSPG